MVPVRRTTAIVVRLTDDATDPVGEPDGGDAQTDPAALNESDGELRGQGDVDGESRAPDQAQEVGRRSFFARMGGRAVVVPLACVAAFLVGFGSMAAVLWLTDEPGAPDAKPAPTTAHPAAPPAAGPAITTPPTSAAIDSGVGSEPSAPPPAPEPALAPAPQAEASEPPAPPSSLPPSTTTPSTTTPSSGGPAGR